MRSRVIVLCVALVAVVAVAAWLRLNSDAQRVATAEQEASSAQLAPGNSAPGVTAAPRVALSGNSRVAAAAAAAAGVGSDSVGTAGVTQPAEIGLQIDTK